MSKSSKLLRMVEYLRDSGIGVRKERLAVRYGLSFRSVSRYFETIREAGYNLVCTNRSGGRFFKLEDSE